MKTIGSALEVCTKQQSEIGIWTWIFVWPPMPIFLFFLFFFSFAIVCVCFNHFKKNFLSETKDVLIEDVLTSYLVRTLDTLLVNRSIVCKVSSSTIYLKAQTPYA